MIRLDLAVVWRESIVMGVHAFALAVDYNSLLSGEVFSRFRF